MFQNKLLLVLYFSQVVCGGLFEPDFGSVVRHMSLYFVVIIVLFLEETALLQSDKKSVALGFVQ